MNSRSDKLAPSRLKLDAPLQRLLVECRGFVSDFESHFCGLLGAALRLGGRYKRLFDAVSRRWCSQPISLSIPTDRASGASGVCALNEVWRTLLHNLAASVKIIAGVTASPLIFVCALAGRAAAHGC